jgi:hypothetical protein
MGKDEHGIDLDEDTNLDTAGDDEEELEAAKREAQRENEGGEEREDAVRERAAAEQENPDNHRDEEPFESD